MVAFDSATRWFTEMGDVSSESMPATRRSDGSLFKNLMDSQRGDGPIHNSSQSGSKQRSVIVWDDHRDTQNKNSYQRRPRCDEEMTVEHQYWPMSQPQHSISDCCSVHHRNLQSDEQQQQQHSVIHRAMPQSHQQTAVDYDKHYRAMPQSHQQTAVDYDKHYKAIPQSHQQTTVDYDKHYRAMPQSNPQIIVDQHHPVIAQLSVLERGSRCKYETQNDVLLEHNNQPVSMLQDVLPSQQQCVSMCQGMPRSEQNVSTVMFHTDDSEAGQKQHIITDTLYQLADSNVPCSANVGLNSQVMSLLDVY